jgi:hypothetical protein
MAEALKTQIDLKRVEMIQRDGQLIFKDHLPKSRRKLFLSEVSDPHLQRLFDESLNLTHYAGACQRVGRCMRLSIIFNKIWVGGIVLGSPFPNIDVRDRSVGIKKYVLNSKKRGLKSPWACENRAYWTRLQRIVNHARTFVFPDFQGQRLGIKAHRLLLTQGIELWEQKYRDKVAALDTLCDHGDSKMFLANGWILVGETKGYSSNPKAVFSGRTNRDKPFKNNVALAQSPDNRKWVVWVKMINSALLS